jgi:hypothetical protein
VFSERPNVASKISRIMLCYQVTDDNCGRTSRSRPASYSSLPAGTMLKVLDGVANAGGFVDVEWDGEIVQIFGVDLRDRGEPIKARSA